MRPRLPEWLHRVCCCSVCGESLLVTESGAVSCFWLGHTGLIRAIDFAELVGAAWRAARKVQIVRETEAKAVLKAMKAVRVSNQNPTPRVSGDDSTRAHADLFAGCPTDGDRTTDDVT